MSSQFSIKSIFTTLISLSFLILFSTHCTAKTVAEASVSETNIQLGDVITLTVSINDNDSDYELDTRELSHIFNVSRPSRSSQTQYINGEFSQQTQWKVALRAKQTGALMIPALNIGSFKTTPIKVTVRKVSSQASNSKNNLAFMENSLNKTALYIGQSVVMTTKIYLLKQSNDLALMTPTLEGAEIVIIPEDKTGQSTVNGKSYNTVTRQYKITPTKTGEFEINSPLLTGSIHSVITINGQNRLKSKSVNVRGSALPITIKEKPKSFAGDWLISEDVRLFDNNDLLSQEIHVGDPITRKITLQIADIEQSKLPLIKLNYPTNVRVYPDKDEITTGQADNGLSYAVRTMSHAIIADKAGTITLPEIKIAWWNSKTDKQAFATIPARELKVLPALKNDQQALAPAFVAPRSEKKAERKTVIVDSPALIYWQIATLILLLLLLLVVAYHFYYRKKQARLTTEKPPTKTDSSLNELIKTLKENNPKMAYRALLLYAQSHDAEIKSIASYPDKTTLSANDKTALKREVKRLELACINEKGSWDSQTLIELLSTALSKKTNEKDSFTSLNPTDKKQ